MLNLDWRNVRMNNKQSFLMAGLFGVALLGTGLVLSMRFAIGQDPVQEAAPPVAASSADPLVVVTETIAGFDEEEPATAYGEAATAYRQAIAPLAQEYTFSNQPANTFQFVGPSGQAPAIATTQFTHDVHGPMHRITYAAVDPKDAELTRKSIEIAMKLQRETKDEAAQADLKKELKDVLAEQFAARQASRKKELADLQERVAKLEKSVAARDENRDEIINKRMNQLLNEPDPMDWEAGPTRSMGLSVGRYFAPADVAQPVTVGSTMSPFAPYARPNPPNPPLRKATESAMSTSRADQDPSTLILKIRALEATIKDLRAAKSSSGSARSKAELEAAEAAAMAARDEAEAASEAAESYRKAAVDAQRAAERQIGATVKPKSGGK